MWSLKKTGREEKERLLSWASVKNEQVQRQQDKLEALLASEVTSGIWRIDLSHDDKTLGELLDCFLRQDQRLDPRRISAALIREGVHMLRGKKNSQMDLPDGFQLKKQDGQVYVCLKRSSLAMPTRSMPRRNSKRLISAFKHVVRIGKASRYVCRISL